MKLTELKITGTSVDRLVNFLKNDFDFDYINSVEDMTLLVSEKFYFRNNSTQMNMIVLKKTDSGLYMDIIGGAGGTGLLNISFWSEKGFIKKVMKVLDKYKENNSCMIEELKI